jgi:hypothetical protein
MDMFPGPVIQSSSKPVPQPGNPATLLTPQVVKHADLRCMEEVRLRVVAHITGNMSKHVECSVNMSQRKFGIGCLGG